MFPSALQGGTLIPPPWNDRKRLGNGRFQSNDGIILHPPALLRNQSPLYCDFEDCIAQAISRFAVLFLSFTCRTGTNSRSCPASSTSKFHAQIVVCLPSFQNVYRVSFADWSVFAAGPRRRGQNGLSPSPQVRG